MSLGVSLTGLRVVGSSVGTCVELSSTMFPGEEQAIGEGEVEIEGLGGVSFSSFLFFKKSLKLIVLRPVL